MNFIEKPPLELVNENCFQAFSLIADASVDAVITDPPYFLDQMGNNWGTAQGHKVTKNSRVSSLPAGMKFSREQGKEFGDFMARVARESLRVLKPGGFFLSFSAPRLVHRLVMAMDEEGFNIRDLWAWVYTQNQVKAMSVARFLDAEGLNSAELEVLQTELREWKTPQIKSMFEPIAVGQKPPCGTFLANWQKYHVGLLNVGARVGEEEGMVPSNLMTTDSIDAVYDRLFLVPKPTKLEKGLVTHLTVKPLALMEQLVRLVAPPGALVLDPFSGSGSTGIAATALGRGYTGFELSPEYFQESLDRFLNRFGGEGMHLEQVTSAPDHYSGRWGDSEDAQGGKNQDAQEGVTPPRLESAEAIQ